MIVGDFTHTLWLTEPVILSSQVSLMTTKTSMAMPLPRAPQLLPGGSRPLTTVAGPSVSATPVQAGGASLHTRGLHGARNTLW